jgi:hypothetical protein
MPRTTHRWMVFGAAFGGGLLLLGVVDLIVRHLVLAFGLAVVGYMLSLPSSPLCHTINLLAGLRSRAARNLADFLPLVFLTALGVGTWQNREHGIVVAVGFTLLLLYGVDRAAAWLIRAAAGYWRFRQMRRETPDTPADDVDDVVADDTVEGEVIR